MVATLKTNILEEVKTLQHQHMQTKAQRYIFFKRYKFSTQEQVVRYKFSALSSEFLGRLRRAFSTSANFFQGGTP